MEEKNCRTKLEEVERNYQELVENVNSVILRMDKFGNVLFLNKFGLEFFGFTQEEIVGRNVVGTIVPEIESGGRNLRFMIQDISIHPERYTSNLNENIKRTGERVWISWTNKPVRNANGRVIEILCIGNDVTKHKKMEEELQILASVVKKSHEMVNLATLDGKMTFLNEEGCRTLGISEEEVADTHILDVIPDYLKEFVQNEVLPKMLKNGSWQGELECQNVKNGNRIKVHTTTFLISDPISGEPLYLANVSRSIGKRKMAEEALKLNEERLRLAMEATKQGWFDLNIQTGTVVVSPEYPKILGYEPEELDVSLQSWIGGMHPEDRDSVLKVFRECINSNATRMMEYRRATKSGEWKWMLSIARVVGFDSEHKPLRMIGTHTDISDRKHAEEALRQSEEKFQKAFMLNPAPTMISCLKSGIFIDVNESFLKASGYDRREVIGKSTVEMDFVSPEERSALMDTLAKNGKVMNVEIKVKIKSGKFRNANLSSEVVKIDEVDCILTVLEDVTDRKKAEQALAESRNYLSKIINAVADPIFVKDTEHRWVLVNDAFCSFMGHGREDLLGKSDYDFLPSEQADVFWMNDASVFETGEENISEELLTDSLGIVHTIVTKKTLYKDERDEQYIVGIIRDITEQKKVENALKENYHFLQTLIDAIPNPIFYKDTRGAYLGFNKSYEQNFGVRRDNFFGSTAFDVFPRHLAQIYHDMDLALLESNQEQIYESRALFADGLEHDVVFYKAPYWSQDGNLAGLVGVVLDITKQKKIENDLQQAKTELEQTFDFLPDATFVIDREGRVIAWNKAIEQMTGIAKEDMLGKNNYEYAIPFYGERRPILIDLVLRDLGKHEEKYQDITRIDDLLVAEAYVPNAYSGKGAYVSGRASPLFDVHGNLIGSIESVRDITERKKAEELMLKEERVKILGAIVGGVAHDTNNQLTLLYGIPEMMLRSKSMQFVEPSFRTMIERIQSAAETIQRTVARLQNFYRPSLNLEPLDINKVAATSVEITKLKWCNMVQKEGVKIEVILDLEKDLPKIMGSENEIKQMFVNLILNAIDSISKQGQITIRTFLRDNKIVVEVTDTGSGMSEHVKEKCLEPFFTTKGEGGSGIGLFSVRRSMSEHEGEMYIKSELGKGTTISLVFPVSKKNQKTTNGEQQKKIPSLEILLIDDDRNVRDMMAEILKNDGHRVIKASGGQEGLSKFSPESCDIVITDLGMPEMSGYEVVEELRKVSDIPIIVSTGFGDHLSEAEKSRLLKFNCVVLSKPAKTAEIQDTIIKVMKL